MFIFQTHPEAASRDSRYRTSCFYLTETLPSCRNSLPLFNSDPHSCLRKANTEQRFSARGLWPCECYVLNMIPPTHTHTQVLVLQVTSAGGVIAFRRRGLHKGSTSHVGPKEHFLPLSLQLSQLPAPLTGAALCLHNPLTQCSEEP